MVMGRCSPGILNEHLCNVHRARGVVLHLGAALTHACRENGAIVLTLVDGTQVTGDAVIYGIGVEPDTRLASAAGLRVDNGILIDENCRTSHPAIYAAGDAASQWNPLTHRYQRRETWENAKNQAIAAARAMMGIEPAETSVPWFWTDQCGMNIQFSGDMAAKEWIVRGEMDDSRFILFGLNDGKLVAAITVNQAREMRSAKMLIDKRARLAADVWRDPQQSLRALLNAA
jgi:3-phenylpropionate/trans-cinnamate dioxygenase ferredoxin reductase subunit